MRARLGLGVALLLLAACSKKEVRKVRTEPWLAVPSASAQSASLSAKGYRLAAGSRVTFTLAGKKAKLSGQVPLLAGELLVDPSDLTRSKAWAEADLGALVIDPSSLPDPAPSSDADVNTLAQRWLELGARVPELRRQDFARARFELVSIEAASATTLAAAAVRGGFAFRLIAIGTLQLHGFRAPVRVPLTISSGGDGAASKLTIRSRGPLVVSLQAHDVSARDEAGLLAPLAGQQFAPFVGRSANVSLELTADPQP